MVEKMVETRVHSMVTWTGDCLASLMAVDSVKLWADMLETSMVPLMVA